MNSYQMLKTISVITNEGQQNFWEQEIYSETEFAGAFFDVKLLIKGGICKKTVLVKEKNEK